MTASFLLRLEGKGVDGGTACGLFFVGIREGKEFAIGRPSDSAFRATIKRKQFALAFTISRDGVDRGFDFGTAHESNSLTVRRPNGIEVELAGTGELAWLAFADQLDINLDAKPSAVPGEGDLVAVGRKCGRHFCAGEAGQWHYLHRRKVHLSGTREPAICEETGKGDYERQ